MRCSGIPCSTPPVHTFPSGGIAFINLRATLMTGVKQILLITQNHALPAACREHVRLFDDWSVLEMPDKVRIFQRSSVCTGINYVFLLCFHRAPKFINFGQLLGTRGKTLSQHVVFEHIFRYRPAH